MDLIDRGQALKALEEICYALWEIDIPSPTVPEYVEHHEGVQAVMEVADRWARKIQALPSARPKGRWETAPDRTVHQTFDECKCSACGAVEYFNKGWKKFNFCPNCGADMR